MQLEILTGLHETDGEDVGQPPHPSGRLSQSTVAGFPDYQRDERCNNKNTGVRNLDKQSRSTIETIRTHWACCKFGCTRRRKSRKDVG